MSPPNNFVMILSAALAVALSGCAGKPSAEILVPVNAPVSAEKSVVVLAATTRERVEDNSFDFTSNRSGNINYQEYAISIPPNHVAGKIEWPSQTPGNAETDFVVISNLPLAESGFAEAIEAQLATRMDLRGSVSVFVHG
jgi:esterase/lipase superfamily enzyme